MNEFRTPTSPRPVHLDFPMALMSLDLTATEMRVYMLLLNRSNLSARRDAWIDGEGRVFLYYPIRALASDARRSETAVKEALCGLVEKDLVYRRRQGRGKPTLIYVKLPRNSRPEGREAPPAEVYDTGLQEVWEA